MFILSIPITCNVNYYFLISIKRNCIKKYLKIPENSQVFTKFENAKIEIEMSKEKSSKLNFLQSLINIDFNKF